MGIQSTWEHVHKHFQSSFLLAGDSFHEKEGERVDYLTSRHNSWLLIPGNLMHKTKHSPRKTKKAYRHKAYLASVPRNFDKTILLRTFFPSHFCSPPRIKTREISSRQKKSFDKMHCYLPSFSSLFFIRKIHREEKEETEGRKENRAWAEKNR